MVRVVVGEGEYLLPFAAFAGIGGGVVHTLIIKCFGVALWIAKWWIPSDPILGVISRTCNATPCFRPNGISPPNVASAV